MERPIKRAAIEQPENFVDELMALYPLQATTAGSRCLSSNLQYVTEECHDYLLNPAEKALFASEGFETAYRALGYLTHLRVCMGLAHGFGICFSNSDLKTTLFKISLDYAIPIETQEQYIELLLKHGIMLVIGSVATGQQYYTTLQQIYNYEHKNFERAADRERQRKRRSKGKEPPEQITQDDAPCIEAQPMTEAAPPVEVPAPTGREDEIDLF